MGLLYGANCGHRKTLNLYEVLGVGNLCPHGESVAAPSGAEQFSLLVVSSFIVGKVGCNELGMPAMPSLRSPCVDQFHKTVAKLYISGVRGRRSRSGH